MVKWEMLGRMAWMRWAALVVVVLALMGCGHGFRIGELSDLSSQEREEVQQVAVLITEQLDDYDYEIIGPVEGASFKHQLWDPAPDADDALMQAKYWAWTKGANALTNVNFQRTGTDYGTNTWASVTCSALALRLDQLGVEESRDILGGATIEIAVLQTSLSQAAEIPSLVSLAIPSVVAVRTRRTHGTGFLISDDGYVITAAHVVGRRSVVEVELFDGVKVQAEVLRTDAASDAALLHLKGVNSERLTPMPVLIRDYPFVGEDVVAIGSPISSALSHTVTRGLVSGVRQRGDVTLIQTDAAVNPGSSGGPLINLHGQVVGMVSSKIVGNRIEGIGFAVAIRDVFFGLRIEPRRPAHP
ncbi:MAG: trypsin-like peptidase domain-containing protein [Planctomycetes bacterium]|nr:trypsin-like peptidase domain-containing protein [Planctomycetota bacterium]